MIIISTWRLERPTHGLHRGAPVCPQLPGPPRVRARSLGQAQYGFFLRDGKHVRYECAASASRRDESIRLESPVGLGDGVRCESQIGSQLPHGRQTFPCRQPAEPDRSRDAGAHLPG
jgi:hypothetical protein